MTTLTKNTKWFGPIHSNLFNETQIWEFEVISVRKSNKKWGRVQVKSIEMSEDWSIEPQDKITFACYATIDCGDVVVVNYKENKNSPVRKIVCRKDKASL